MEYEGKKEEAVGPTGLTRQPSNAASKAAAAGSCLCSPTTHAGSFRCRLHRAPSGSLQRTKSLDLAKGHFSSSPKPSSCTTPSTPTAT